MAKKETIQADVETPVKMPDQPKVLTQKQQAIKQFVDSAKKEPPRIEDVKDLSIRIEMEIPKGVARGPEYEYAWLSIADMDKDLYSGSKWEIVTRTNHSHVPERTFGLDGAITYRGQNILAFCYRDTYDAEQKAIVDAFNSKTDSTLKKNEEATEEVATVDSTNLGRVHTEEALPTGDTDFGET